MTTQAALRMVGSSDTTTTHQLYLIDKDGLITKDRTTMDPTPAPFTKDPTKTEGLKEGASLLEVVLRAMRDYSCLKPVIFAMSNPTLDVDCTAIDVFKHAGDHIVFGSGSPVKNVDLGNGKVGHINQANNMYLLPGLAHISYTFFFL